MKTTLTILLSLLFSLALSAQTDIVQNIKGQVIDTDTGLPLIGANVQLLNEEATIGTSTDVDGYYTLNDLPVGRYSLMCTYLGYKQQQFSNMLLTSGKELIINFSLSEQVILDEVTITATKETNAKVDELATISIQSFDSEVASRYAGSRNDVARMAAGFAGVSANDDSRNDIVIRGNSPAGLLWKLDGIDIPNPSHFGALGATGGPVSMLNNNLLDNSLFMTGAFPAIYGNALSGVFDLSLRKGNKDKHEFTAQVGFNGVELGAEGPFSKKSSASYLINYRYSVVDLVSKLGSAAEGTGTGNAIPRYQDLSFKVNVPTSKAGVFTLIGLAGNSGIDFLAEELDPENPGLFSQGNQNLRYQSNMGITALTNKHYYSNKTFGKASLAFSRAGVQTKLDTLTLALEEVPIYRDDSFQDRIRLAYDVKHKWNTQHSLMAGVNANQMSFTFKDSTRLADSSFRSLRDFSGSANLFQAYAQWQYKPSDKWVINTGIFSQLFDLNNTYSVEPRINARYEISPSIAATAGLGRHSKLQDFQLYLLQTEQADGSFLNTNKDLEMTRSDQAMIGLDFYLSRGWSLKTEAYYQSLSNVPIERDSSWYSAINEGADFGIPSVDSLVNGGTGTNYGVELTLEKAFVKGFYMLATASFFDSKYTASDQIERSTAFDNGYVANVLTGKEFTISNKFSIATDIKLTTAGGRRYTPIDLELSEQQGTAVFDRDRILDAQFDDYRRIDIKLTLRHNMKRASQEWSVDLQNAFNNQNIFSQSYDAETNSINNTYQLGRYPVINYKITF